MTELPTKKPLVSVVMPAYNAASTIIDSIKSVQQQSYANWELLVVDDCSMDNTVVVVRALSVKDSRIKLIVLDANSGRPAHPRNVGIKEAAGELIAFLDADDEWTSAKLEKQVYFMSSLSAAFSCSSYDVISCSGALVGGFEPPPICSYDDLLVNNSIGCLTAMYDVRILGKRYFPLCGHEDYALWLKILREGYLVYGLKESLAFYRLTPGSASSNKLKVMKFFWNIYKNQEKFSSVKAMFLCVRYAWNARRKYG